MLSNYLHRLGNEIIILTQRPKSEDKSDFIKYTNFLNKKNIYFYDFGRFNYINKKINNILNRIFYKITLLTLKLLTNEYIYDPLIIDKKVVLNKLRKTINNVNPDIIICTAPPFNLCYLSAKLKTEYPTKLFVTDLRDPWTLGPKMLNLKGKRRAEEMRKEMMCLRNSDLVLVPVEIMKRKLIEAYPEVISKIHVLPHGYDQNFYSIKNMNTRLSAKIRLIYAGTILDNTKKEFTDIADCLEKNTDLELDFYTENLNSDKIGEFNRVFKKGKLEYSKILSTIASYDYLLIVHPFCFKDNISTKIIETIATGTPICYIGYPGELSDFIVENDFGVYISPGEIKNKLHFTYLNQYRKELNLNMIKNFDLDNISNYLNNILNK